MKYRSLGRSGLLVSPVCLGTMTFGTPVEERDAIRLTHAAIDLGINFVDTANVYEGYNRYLGSPGGAAEEIVGKALCDRRDRVILATKVGAPVGPGPQDRGLSAVHLLRELDRSLTRLRTEVIDLYIIHWPDRETPLDVTLRAMDVAVEQGKIRYFGVSNHPAWQLCEFLSLADRAFGPRLVCSQIPLSLLRREMEHDLTFCERYEIGVTPYQALQSGLLTGKYRRNESPPAGSRAAEKPDWVWKTDDPLFDRLDGIASLAREAGMPMAQYALAWTLAQPAVDSVIVGAKRLEQIDEAVEASRAEFPSDHLVKINTICPPPWHLPDPIRGA